MSASESLAVPRPASPFRVSPTVILLLLAALIALARLHTYDEPMDRDLGDYATIAHEMHMGKRLYTELPDQKPPAIHLTYYAAEAVAGYGRGSRYLLTVAGAILGLIGAYAAATALTGKRAAGLWAAAFWAALSGHVRLEGNQPNTELFMNAFILLGSAFLLRAVRSSETRWRGLILAGLCFGWATLYKQVIVVTPVLMALACIALPPAGKSRWRALMEMTAIGAIIAGMWGITVGILAWGGQLSEFITCVYTYNIGYAGSLALNLKYSFIMLPQGFMLVTVPTAIAALAGIVLGLIRRQFTAALFLIAMLVGTHCATALPGRYFPHYYQLWLPWMAIGAAFAVTQAERAFRNAPTVVGASVLGCILAIDLPYYAYTAEQWSIVKFGPSFYYTNTVVARVINRLLKPEETFFQMADETELYPVTGRRPPSGILGIHALNESEIMRPLRLRMVEDLKRAKPDMIVMSFVTPYPELAAMMKADYAPLPVFSDGEPEVMKLPNPRSVHKYDIYMFCVRKGSALEARCKAAAGKSTPILKTEQTQTAPQP